MVVKSLTFCFCLMMVVGCSPKQVSSDYDKSVDFSVYKTYAWPPSAEDFVASFTENQLTKDINLILQHRGFELVEESPDLVVRYQTGRKQVFAEDGTMYGGGHGYTYDEGTLKIEFIDPRQQVIVWEGTSKVMLSTDERPTKEKVKGAVLDILDNFPPGAK